MYAYIQLNLTIYLFEDVLKKRKNNDIYRHLSKNETMAVYKETDDELLIIQLLSLHNAQITDELEGTENQEDSSFNKRIDNIVAESKKFHRQYHIWHSARIVKYLLNLLNFGDHFTKSRVMQTGRLKGMSDSHGGVSDRIFNYAYN